MSLKPILNVIIMKVKEKAVCIRNRYAWAIAIPL